MDKEVGEIFVIGGQSLFNDALSDPLVDSCKLMIGTRINKEYESDVYMPELGDRFDPIFIS